MKFGRRIGEQLLVVQESVRNAARAVGHHDDPFERHLGAEFFVNRQEHIVDQKEAVAGMADDAGNFVRLKANVERVENASGARNPEKGFEMARVVPHHRGDAVAGLKPEFGERRRKAPGARVEIAITGAGDGFVRLAGDDLDAREKFPRPLQDGG